MMTSIIQNVIEISVRSGNADRYGENGEFEGFTINMFAGIVNIP